MTRMGRAGLAAVSVFAIGLAASLHAQVRGGTEWTTSRLNAQRTAWMRGDVRITKNAVKKGEFAFLWKAKFENEARQLNALTEPILLDQLIGYRGFKSLAMMGGSADRVFAIDTDLHRPYWTANLTYAAATGGQPPSSWDCPGGLTATPSRRTVLAPSAFGGGNGGRGGGATSAVGEPGKGAAALATMKPQPTAPPAASATPPRTGDAPAPTAPPPSAVAPIPFGGVDPLYTIGADGLLRTLRVSDGAEMTAPVPFLPPSAKPSSVIFIDGVVYTSTSEGCGAAPNAVWAIDLTTKEAKPPVSWQTGGASIVGPAGPAFGTDGTLYVALGNAPSARTTTSATSDANAVVALDRRTLQPKDWFMLDGVGFSASPTIVRYKDKDLIAAPANDGKLYLLDSASLGGSDHKTPMFASAKYTDANVGGALAAWDDGTTQWILAPATGTHGSIVAFKLVDRDGTVALEQGWQSREITSPLAPIVVNGLVMAVASGEYRGYDAQLTADARAQKSTPAVLYVLDGGTGQEMWNSGTTITSFARAGLSAGGGQVYLVTYDNHLYAFGIPLEH